MADKNCSHCGGRGEFDPQLAFARLAKRQEAMADVVSRFMDATEQAQTKQARAGVRGQPGHAVETADLVREFVRIVGGRPTAAFPDCCLVGHRNSNGTIEWFCSGVLIHPQIVLTAGHCFVPETRANVVALATSNQNKLGGAELINIRRLVVNPRYQQTQQVSDMMVAILRTPAKTKAIAVASTDELVKAGKVTLVGFGNEDVNSTKGFGVKREVEVDITSIRRSAADDLDADENRLGYESDLEFVAGGNGFDTCNGDSGGPVYIQTETGMKLAGLTSRATETAINNCGDGGIYTRVDKHLDFIRQVARDAGVTDFA